MSARHLTVILKTQDMCACLDESRHSFLTPELLEPQSPEAPIVPQTVKLRSSSP